MRLDHALAEGQAYPRSRALGLRREEWLEDAASSLGRDTGTIIGNLDADAFLVRVVKRRDRDPTFVAALLQCLLSVDQQVDQYLMELIIIGRHRRQPGPQTAA